MLMKNGERWHCTNPVCRCAILVESSGEVEGHNPSCACGSPMKKQYSPPVLQYLDFIRSPDLAVARRETPGE